MILNISILKFLELIIALIHVTVRITRGAKAKNARFLNYSIGGQLFKFS